MRRFWWSLGLPTLPPAPLDPETARRFDDYTETWMGRAGSPPLLRPPGSALAYLRWLAEQHEPLFHGSHRDGIGALRPDRESRATTPFGDQEGVFASDDPVWAMWFALLTHQPGFQSTRNGAWFFGSRDLKRFYLFSVNRGAPDEGLLSDGWLYLLPRDGFRHEPRIGGLLWSSQWVNPGLVRPMARIAVSPEDFPFADCIGRHDPDESMLRTLLRASADWYRVASARSPSGLPATSGEAPCDGLPG